MQMEANPHLWLDDTFGGDGVIKRYYQAGEQRREGLLHLTMRGEERKNK